MTVLPQRWLDTGDRLRERARCPHQIPPPTSGSGTQGERRLQRLVFGPCEVCRLLRREAVGVLLCAGLIAALVTFLGLALLGYDAAGVYR